MASQGTTTAADELDRMARNLSEELAAHNMSVDTLFSKFSAVSLRPLNVDTGNTTSSGGEAEVDGEVTGSGSGLEVSDGVVWTLVAPLIFLGVLVVIGVVVGCLWRLRERRCQNGEAVPENGEGGRDVTTGEMEMQEVHGDYLNSPPGSGPHARGAALHPQGLYHDPARHGQLGEGEARACPHHSQPQPLCFPGSGDRGHKGVRLPDLDDPAVSGELVTGPEEVSFARTYSAGRRARRKPSLESLEHLEMVGVVAQGGRVRSSKEKGEKEEEEEEERWGVAGPCRQDPDRYCDVCQGLANRRYDSKQDVHQPYPRPHPHPHPHPRRQPPRQHQQQQQQQQQQYQHREGHGNDKLGSGRDLHGDALGTERPQHCRHCEPLRAAERRRRQQLVARSHDNHLHLAHRPWEAKQQHPQPHPQPHPLPQPQPQSHLLASSQSMDDHLHLVPRYQPPHPAHVLSPGRQDDPRRLQDVPEATRMRNSYHGVENPLFVADAGDVVAGVSGSSGHVSASFCAEVRAEGVARGRGRRPSGAEQRGLMRIISSTRVVSPREGGVRGQDHHYHHHHHPDQGHPVKCHPVSQKALIQGPDVSSIKLLSNTSQAWRASHHLLPSTFSSTETPSCSSNADDGSGDGQEETVSTLSLPSSISRFHASRVQFPPLLADALYPLTSTKAVFSPSLPCLGNIGVGETGAALDTLDHFSDNTSMQPNVGSSVTSGQISDARGSHTVSSTLSDPWGAPTSACQPPASPGQRRNGRGGLKSEGSSNDADVERGRTWHAEYAESGRVSDRAYPALGKAATASASATATSNDARSVTAQGADDYFTNDSDFTDARAPPGSKKQKKSDAAIADVPSSASQLRRAGNRQGIGHREPSRSERKQGFFLIPRQSRRSGGNNVYKYHRAPREEEEKEEGKEKKKVPDDVAQPRVKPSSGRRLVSPSRRRGGVGGGQPQTQKHGRDRQLVEEEEKEEEEEEREEQARDRAHPAAPRNSLAHSATGSPARVEPRLLVAPFGDKEALGGRRKRAVGEQHPAKLHSCRPQPRPFSALSHDDGRNPINDTTPSHGKEGRSEGDDKAGSRRAQPARRRQHAVHPLADPMLLKASCMSASFPDVTSVRQSLSRATLDSARTPTASRAKVKRVKNQEDHAYVNMGGTFFDDLPRDGRSEDVSVAVPVPVSLSGPVSGAVAAAGAVSAPFSSLPAERRPPARTEQRPQQPSGLPNAKTDSQILQEVMNSFPPTVSPYGTHANHGGGSDGSDNSSSNKKKNHQGLHGGLYPDMNIPTAFADELFGIWSLSPERDISPSQPRTPLMTPLKDEAKRANAKFIWGNSGSPSGGSTSTSSFYPGWLPQEDGGGLGDSQHVLARQTDADNESDDYVQMGKNSSSGGPPRGVSPAQMSVSDPASSEPAPPTPVSDDRQIKSPDHEDEADSLGVGDDYKGLPRNNLNLSQRYVISGDLGKDDFNNNPPATSTANTSNVEVDATSAPPHKVTDTSDGDPTPSALAVVLDEQKVWL